MKVFGRNILTPQSLVAWGIAGAAMYAWHQYDVSQNSAVFSTNEQQKWNDKVKSNTSAKDE